ncbi:MAG: LamG domain-containing protein [Nanoarchaeota archaeon]|nr:LamG domain-containing protein [Nanoarchaeota archaeon]
MRKKWWMIIIVLIALLVVVASYNYITTGVLFAPFLDSDGADGFIGEESFGVVESDGAEDTIIEDEELKVGNILERLFAGEERVAPRTFKVFATDSNFTGDVLNRADEICNDAASNAGLRGNYVALLSTTREHAVDKIQDGKYLRVDGVKIADNKRDLFDGTIDNPLNVNEFGNVLPTLTCDSNGFECNLIYTGSKVDGTLDPGFNCNDWNSISALSTVGHYPSVDHNWINTNNVSCSEVLGIYCFESYVTRPECDEVYTVRDLDNVRNDLDACYIQMADIDMTGVVWEPIGQIDLNMFPSPNDRPFTGRYDGNGFKITNFEIPETNASALFAYSTGIIENVTIDGFNIDTRNSLGIIGSLIAVNEGVVRNSLAKNGFMRVAGSSILSEGIGGLIGANLEGNIRNSGVIRVTIFGNSFVGGLMGGTLYGIIESTYAEDVNVQSQGRDRFVGGLIGVVAGTGSIKDTNITDSYATGNVGNGNENDVGGLIGGFEGIESELYNSHFRGVVNGRGKVGGLIGSGEFVTVGNSYSLGTVNGDYDVGGLIGVARHVDIVDSFSTSTVQGKQFVGGLVGGMVRSSIKDSHSSGNVSGEISVGGLIGSLWQGDNSIFKSYATGNVFGRNDVGGFAGYISDSALVNESFALGNVVGNISTIISTIGGFAGINGGNVTNSFSKGSVLGTNLVGGFVGSDLFGVMLQGAPEHSYSTGFVSGNYSVGGFSGGGTLVSNTNYWDIETSNQTTSAGGVGKTTAEMKRQNTFENWDFNRVWDIAEDRTYPFLRWMSEEELVVHYKFDEITNGKTPDSSIFRYDADVSGATLWQWGNIDKALNFSGWRDFVSVEDTPFLYSDKEITISAWVNTKKKWKPLQTIAWKGNPEGSAVNSSNREFALFLAGSEDPSAGGQHNSKVQIVFTPENRIGVGQIPCTTNTFPIRAENWWYHVAGVIDVRNQVMKIYVDGVEVKTCNILGISNIRNTNGSLVVGNKMPLPAGSSAGFTGMIDDFRLYSRVLSDVEIFDLANV